jgi:hypothetical protein
MRALLLVDRSVARTQDGNKHSHGAKPKVAGSKQVREALGLHAGDRLALRIRGDRLLWRWFLDMNIVEARSTTAPSRRIASV